MRSTLSRRGSLALAITSLAAGLLVIGPTPAAADPPPPGNTFTPMNPVRVLDTRDTSTPVGPDSTISLDLSAKLPSSATTVVINLTATSATAWTWVTAYPNGTPRPNASSLNLGPGQTRPNAVTVTVGVDRKLALYNAVGNVHLIADLSGYYSPGAGSLYTPLHDERALDTRWSTIPDPGPNSTTVVDLSTRVPPSATAVTFSLTATQPTESTWITAFPAGKRRPLASNLNVVAGETAGNFVTVALGSNRQVILYNAAGNVHLLVDLIGFYSPDFGAVFVPTAPTRILDTRDGTGTSDIGPIGPATNRVNKVPMVPEAALAAVVNLTATSPTADTHLTGWTTDYTRPRTFSLSIAAGQTRASMAIPVLTAPVLAPNGPLWPNYYYVYNDAGSVHAIADLAGYFILPTANCQTGCVSTWSSQAWRHPGGGPTVSTPRQVSGLSGVKAIAGAAGFGYALLSDGSVRRWGHYAGHTAGWFDTSWAPVPVNGVDSVTAIASGGTVAYGLRSDGTVRQWGDILSTQIKAIPGLTEVTAIAGIGRTGYALRSDGTVWAWGTNTKGQLGDGSTVEQSDTPVRVSGLTGIVAIGAGYNNGYAVKSDGTLWAWGDNQRGLLGNGQACDTCLSRTPVRVSGLTDAKSVVGGATNAFALRADGTVTGWGDNESGGLGNGLDCEQFQPANPNCRSTVPVPVSNLTDVKSIATNRCGGHAVKNDGTAWSWGTNRGHELGDPSSSEYPPYRTKPVPVYGLTGVRAIAGGLALVS